MLNKRKQFIAVWIMVFVSTLGLGLLSPQIARAESVDVENLVLDAVDAAHIQVTFTYDGEARSVTLTDSNSGDSNYKYEKVGDSRDGCHGDLTLANHRNQAYKDAANAIKSTNQQTRQDLQDGDISDDEAITRFSQQQTARVALLGTHAVTSLDLDFKPTTSSACVEINGADGGDDVFRISNAFKLLVTYRHENETIVRVDGSDDWVFEQIDDNPRIFHRASEEGDECRDFMLVNSSGTSAQIFELATGDNSDIRPSIVETEASGCRISDFTFNNLAFFTDGNDEGQWIHHYSQLRNMMTINAITNQPTPPPGNGGGGGSGGGGGASGPVGIEETCENNGGKLAFIFCPLLGLFDNITDYIDNQMVSLLFIPDSYLDGNELEGTVGRIRNLAYTILVPIMLVMVLGTAMGFEFVSAYTVKKAMPRLAIAAIFIAVSFPLLRFGVTFINEIGTSIYGFLIGVFHPNGDLDLEDVFGTPGGAGILLGTLGTIFAAGTVLAIGSIGILLSYGLIMVVAILLGFFFLALRQMLIITLILVAPLAILAWIFPGNDKPWKLWWQSFSKLLLLFPMIMALIAVGRIFADIVDNSPIDGLMETGLKILGYFGPYLFIPALFKLAGGAFATITGMVNDRSRGLFDRQRKYRGAAFKQNWADTQAGRRFKSGKEGSFRSKLNTGLQGASMINRAGFRPSRWKENMTNAIGDSRWEGGQKGAEEIPGAKAFFANDDGMLATLEGDGDLDKATNYLVNQRGYQKDQARVVAAKGLELRNKMGAQAFALTALSKLPGTGTAYKGERGVEAWLRDINKYTGGNKSLAASVVAAGKGGFRNAQQYEFSEAGFGDMMSALDVLGGRSKVYAQRDADGNVMRDADGNVIGEAADPTKVGEFITTKAYRAVGASGIVNARNADSAATFARAAVRDMKAAVDSGDKATIGRTIAQIENIRDAGSQGKRVVTDAFIAELEAAKMDTGDPKAQNVIQWAKAKKEEDDPVVMAAYDEVKHDFSRDQAAAQAQQAASQASAAAAAQGATGTGGTGTGGPGSTGPSDRRLKRNVSHLATTLDGIQLYRFQYIWSDEMYVGVMAQDLLDTHPEAVYMAPDGYYQVNYSVLGLEMLTYDQWQAQQVSKTPEIYSAR